MRFTETKVAGAFLIEPEPIADERGFFARTWCREEFADHGLNPELAQANISFNHRKGTLSAPYAPQAARGVRFDDPAFGIAWPGEVLVINERDRTYPDFAP